MTENEFKSQILHAAQLALDGHWKESHNIVQKFEEDRLACWVHALLHKIEGDPGNAKYWYRRAGRDWTDGDPAVELKKIVSG